MVGSAFSQFVRTTRPALLYRAFLLCGDWDEAEDLVQRTLIQVYLHGCGLEQRAEFAAFTRSVMVRTFLSDRRAARRPCVLVSGEMPEPDPEPDDQERLADRLLLLAALARLGPRQRAVIVLRYWEQLSVREAADALSCSLSTVRSQTSRALVNLRPFVQYEPDPARRES